jgi:hypothetical protein
VSGVDVRRVKLRAARTEYAVEELSNVLKEKTENDVVKARVHFFNSEGDPLVLAEVELEAGNWGKVTCLLDSGASGRFVRCSSGLLEGAKRRQYTVPKRMVFLDGMKAQGESIREWVEAKVDLGGGMRTIVQWLDVAEVGGSDVIFGADWHQGNGVVIDWNTMTVAMRGKGETLEADYSPAGTPEGSGGARVALRSAKVLEDSEDEGYWEDVVPWTVENSSETYGSVGRTQTQADVPVGLPDERVGEIDVHVRRAGVYPEETQAEIRTLWLLTVKLA